MKKLIVFGTGDLGQLAKFYFEHDSEYSVAAFTVDRAYRTEDVFCGLPVYDFEDIETYFPPDEYEMFIAIGYKQVNKSRARKYNMAKKKGYRLASYISTHAACLIDRESVGDNCFILENNAIEPFVKVGNDVIMWGGGIIAHHSVIGDHVFIASHAVLLGRTTIGDYSFIGANATVNDHVQLGERCVVGSGALITSDTEPDSVYKNIKATRDERSSAEVNYFKMRHIERY